MQRSSLKFEISAVSTACACYSLMDEYSHMCSGVPLLHETVVVDFSFTHGIHVNIAKLCSNFKVIWYNQAVAKV